MKKQFLAFAAMLCLSGSLNAQWMIADCSKMCVTGIEQDSANANNLLVTVFHGDTSDTHINYPYVEFLIASNGDTVATGSMNFFAHMSGTSQTYDVTRTAEPLPQPFTGFVHLTYATGNGDTTCVLEYPCLSTPVVAVHFKSEVIVFPNPVKEKIGVRWNGPTGIRPYKLTDASGKTVRSGDIENGGEINLIDISSGVYFITIFNGKEISLQRLIVN